jgi:hypothetical protein
MRSCLNCKHSEEMLFEDIKKCSNPKSMYFQEEVQKKDLCREWECD